MHTWFVFWSSLNGYTVLAGPEKRPIPSKVVDSGNGVFRIEFTTAEVGTYASDVTVAGNKSREKRIYR